MILSGYNRGGKTQATVTLVLLRALHFEQSTNILSLDPSSIWAPLRRGALQLGFEVVDDDLKVKLPNGSTVRVVDAQEATS